MSKSLTLEADSHGGSRVATDLGGWFGDNQQFGYRVNAAYEDIHPYVEHADGKTFVWFLGFRLENFRSFKT